MTVEALRRGRPEVLADLLARYGKDIQAVAYMIVRDRSAAEDVLADTLLAALDHGGEIRDADALRPWLLRIATNKALRHRQRGVPVIELDVVDQLAEVRGGPDAADLAALWQAVSELPPRMRAAIGLRYYLDLPVEAVAAALDVSPNTIKTQLKSALAHLRVALADEPAGRAEVRHASLDDAVLEQRLRRVLADRLGALPLDLTVDGSKRAAGSAHVSEPINDGLIVLGLAAALMLPVAWLHHRPGPDPAVRRRLPADRHRPLLERAVPGCAGPRRRRDPGRWAGTTHSSSATRGDARWLRARSLCARVLDRLAGRANAGGQWALVDLADAATPIQVVDANSPTSPLPGARTDASRG